MASVKARTLAESFRFAIAGALHAFRTERNLRIHAVTSVVVIGLGITVGVAPAELALLFLTIGLVIAAELFNTAVETAVDLWSPTYHPLAAMAKNVAAAAVLVPAVVAVVVGFLVFRDYVSPWAAAGVGGGLAFVSRLVEHKGPKRRLTQLTSVDVDKLLEEARAVRERAYVPHSGFKVGAALLTKSGRIITGCNFENASLGATICAERAAVGAALSAGEREWVALAVVADYPEPVTPCGICRQVLAEFAPDMPVHMANLAGERRTMTVRELLPGMFQLPAAGAEE